jgi:beta-lactamase class A
MKAGPFLALFLSLAAPAAAQPPATQAADPARVQAEVRRIATAAGGTWGVAARDLSTGRTLQLNAGERFKLASTLKAPLAAYALHLADQGRLSLEEPIRIAPKDLKEAGILERYFKHPGVAVSTLNLIELSLVAGDNAATDQVLARVGGPAAVTAWLRSRGYGDMRIDRSIRETFAPPPARGAAPDTSALDTTTPLAMSRFLADLYGGRLVSAERTALLLDIMTRTGTGAGRIPGRLPPGVKVPHKTGTLEGGATNDVGYIIAPEGRAVVIAVYSKGVSEDVDLETRERTIANIARAVWDGFLFGP